MMAGKLYIVPSPIGNLGDMSPRAIEILKKVNLILAEDTRTSSVLTRHFRISTPMRSHHKYNEHKKIHELVERIGSDEDVALISDAGTPGISDPGFLLSRECVKAGIEVECLPGPTAFVPALVASGFPCDRFVFEGFLPLKKGRKARMEELSTEERTVIIYESPKRLARTLRNLIETFGEERQAAVCRELSKIHEEIKRGSLGELAEYYTMNQAKGEIVLVISGISRQKNRKTTNSYEKISIDSGDSTPYGSIM